MRSIKKLGIIVNASKGESVEFGKYLAATGESIGMHCKIETNYPIAKDFAKDMDACCVIGGDGTILSAVSSCIQYNIPLFGINYGRLGFLATFSAEEIKTNLTKIIEGDYIIDKRFVLEMQLKNGKTELALNDVVIKHMAPSRMMAIEVHANEQYVSSYAGDGLILATPTGSTAYNLSAGGPIVNPGASVLLMTPICPHTLTNRTVVFDNETGLTIHLLHKKSEDIMLASDGRIVNTSIDDFPLSIKISKQHLSLMHPTHYVHFKTLRNKLRWND